MAAPVVVGGVGGVVNTSRYPLSDPDGTVLGGVVARVRGELAAVGCSVLRDFVDRALRDDLRREGEQIAPRAHYGVETVNVYNTAPDPSLPPHHPARVPLERGNAFVARDAIPTDALIHRLYASVAFQRFVAACFALPAVYELADPLSGLTLNVVTPGRGHPWHFDVNEFTVTMLTREPEDGGVFEYCPGIRSARDENLDDVRAVLDGRGDHLVHRLPLRAGDLQLFAGRYALHRVATVRGAAERHSAIFAYSDRPGVISSLARTRQLFGRISAEHHAAAARRPGAVDGLLD